MTTTEYAAMIEAARQEGREELAAVTRGRDELLRVCTEIAEATGYMHEGDGFAPQPCEPSELPALMGRLRSGRDDADARLGDLALRHEVVVGRLTEERDEARSALLAADDRAIEARAEVAQAIAYAEYMAEELSGCGEIVRSAEWQDFVQELREGNPGRALARLIAEKQAEALEALLQLGCFACAMLMLECGQCEAIRERAAAYRKGGAP